MPDSPEKYESPGQCVKRAMMRVLAGCGREKIKCCYVSINQTPGVGCCDSLLVRNTEYRDLADQADGNCVCGPFELTYEVTVTMCPPSKRKGKDALSPKAEALLADAVEGERAAILRHFKTYLCEECKTTCKMNPRFTVSPRPYLQGGVCVGTRFQVRFRVHDVQLPV